MMEIIEASMVQKPDLRPVKLGKRRPPITIKAVPIAIDRAFCIAPSIAPICVAIR